MLKFIKKIIPLDFFLRIWWHRLTGFLAALFYGYPAKNLRVIGVTGTDGKTSTVEFLVSILESLGFKVGLASTIRFQIGSKKWSNTTHKTTLGRFALQKLLKRMAKEKCDVVVLEVSSHALEQGRLIGVPFQTAVITNLSQEHLDFHRTMNKYSLAKQKLFKNLKSNNGEKTSIVVNVDDKYVDDFIRHSADTKISYSKNTQSNRGDINIYPININLNFAGTSYTLNIDNQKIDIDLKTLGSFSIYNSMAATGAVLNYIDELDDHNMRKIKKGLEKIDKVPGRMELVGELNKNNPYCLIDFALTPKAVEALYQTTREINPKGRIISIFGSCGDRDKSKRPRLGKLAMEYVDLTIVCDDESYGEDMDGIRLDILKGALGEMNIYKDRDEKLSKDGIYKYNEKLFEIPDRELAIQFGIKNANPGDTVLVTGIGDFDSRMIYGKKTTWDERGVIIKALGNRN